MNPRTIWTWGAVGSYVGGVVLTSKRPRPIVSGVLIAAAWPAMYVAFPGTIVAAYVLRRDPDAVGFEIGKDYRTDSMPLWLWAVFVTALPSLAVSVVAETVLGPVDRLFSSSS
jgi:hypothetical protein